MRCLFLFALVLTVLPLPAASANYPSAAQTWPVDSVEQIWHDPARDRNVPVKIYFPAGPQAPATSPVIVFSHGLGGSREGYGYLGKYWAAHGYISVHVQHAGSDIDSVRGLRFLHNLRRAGSDLEAALDRPRDIRFAIDRLAALNHDTTFALHGRLDLEKLGVAGHSYGAVTAMAVADAHIPALDAGPVPADPRVKAAIAMSTPAILGGDTDAAYAL